MAEKKLPENALLKNAEKRIKELVPKGEKAYATADGQVFARPGASAEVRKNHAQNWAARFVPPLEVKDFVGEFVAPTPKKEKRNAEEVIADIKVAETVEAVNALIEGDTRVTVVKAADARKEELNNAETTE